MRRFVTGMAVPVLTASTMMVGPGIAHGATSGSEGPGGTVSVGASDGGSSGGSPGAPAGSGGGAGSAPVDTPWTCSYQTLVLNDDGPPGGPTPGGWFSVTCTNSQTGAITVQTEWIPDQVAPAAPPVDPRSLALQAENSLQLPAPVSHFNPSGTAVVNLPTWLWIDSGVWHAYSVTASVGSVSATAVAMPTSVTWSMGDGATVVCRGPGVPFDAEEPSSQQTTSCQYSYPFTSAGQPSADGDPDHGAFHVKATIAWSVTWSAEGAPGGGSLPALSTSSSTSLRVEQVESVNTLRLIVFGPFARASEWLT